MNDWRDRDRDIARTPSLDTPPKGPSRSGNAVRSRRRPQVLWIVLLALLVLFTAVDRLTARVAESRVASWIQSTQKLPSKPQVHIGGFPFLAEAALGKYSDVEAVVRGLAATPGPRVEQVTAHLNGVHVPLGDAMRNQVRQVPVDAASAGVFVTFADLNAFLKNQPGSLQVQPDGNGLEVSSGVFPALLSARISVENNGFTIVPTAVGVGGLDLPVPDGVQDAVKSPLPVPLSNLPFHLRPSSVTVHRDALELRATADKLVFHVPPS